jgi:hypothetical protein
LRRVSENEIEAALGSFDEIEPIGDRSGSGDCCRSRDALSRIPSKQARVALALAEAHSCRSSLTLSPG